MKIFLTGGTGFIGSNFISKAIENGHEIIAVKRSNSVPRIDLENQPTWVLGDLEGDYRPYLKKCDIFIHLAAYGVIDNSDNLDECLRWNVIATYNLCKQAHESGVNKFVIFGSCFEYGRAGERYDFIPTTAPLEPVTAYAASKASASVLLSGWAAENNVYMKILRVFHVFGNGESSNRLWPSLYDAAISGSDFDMTKGEQVRDFINVKEVASDLINELDFSSIEKGLPTIKNVGSGQPKSVYDFCTYWWNKWNAAGKLNVGVLPYRKNEVMRFVPKV